MNSLTTLRKTFFWLALPLALLLAGCILAPPGEEEAPTQPAAPVQSGELATPTPQPTVTPPPGGSSSSATAPAPGSSGSTAVVPAGRSGPRQYSSPPAMSIDPGLQYTAIITTNRGQMVMELYIADAPMTVNNFVFLAREGFYDGVPFHRIIKGFMVQTGDPTGTGAGGPGYRFADESVTRGYTKGIVAMANAGPNTNGSQFFIVHADDAGLPPAYTIFGGLTSGLATLDGIADTPVRAARSGERSVPTEPVIIQKVEIQENSG